MSVQLQINSSKIKLFIGHTDRRLLFKITLCSLISREICLSSFFLSVLHNICTAAESKFLLIFKIILKVFSFLLITFSFLFVFFFGPSPVMVRVTPGGDQRTIWDAMDQTQVSCVQNKHLYLTSPFLSFLKKKFWSDLESSR